MANKYDVIVIGSGLGGSVCAALLAKKGVKTLLLDKNNKPGGKSMGITVKGFQGEMWPTFGIPIEGGPFVEAFRQLGIEDKLDIKLGSTAMMYRRKGESNWITMVDLPGVKVEDPSANFFESWGLNQEEKVECIKVLAEIAFLTPEQLDELDDVTVQQWIERKGDVPPPIQNFLRTHSNLMATGVYETVAMSEIARIMQVFSGRTNGYPRGGYGRIIDDILDVFKANGGELLTSAKVESITVKEGRVTGVKTKDKVFEAPIVVSNAGLQPTILKLVGEEHFDKSYVGYVRDMPPSLGFTCVRYLFTGIYLRTISL
jgi:prolycopene isomerase